MIEEIPEETPKPDTTQKTAPSVVNSPLIPRYSPGVNIRPDGNGLSPFPRGPVTKFNWLWAREFVIKLQTRYMEQVLKDPGMPSSSQINLWSEKYPKFKEWISRSRRIFADYLAERSASMFDEPPVMEKLQTKNGVYERISMSGVQRERYKSQAMFNLAAKFNPEQYGEKIQMSGDMNVFNVIANINGPKTMRKMKKAKTIEGDSV